MTSPPSKTNDPKETRRSPMSDDGSKEAGLLPGAVVSRDWMHVPSDRPESRIPDEYAAGLWALDAAVRDAIRGGWSDDEIRNEIDQLLRSHRPDETETAPA